jgi:predicted negative regulator of RcsB-dependent stress response
VTPRLPAALAAALAVGSFLACAYYNGLYNANRLVGEAEKAEREGRIGEARSLWSQAAVKAESVATRYPDSRYRDDALVLQGEALRATGECALAKAPLSEALETSVDTALRKRAALALGQCCFETGEYEESIGVLEPLAEGTDTLWSRPARLWRGRSLLETGSYAEAATDLEGAPRAEAAFDLSVAYALLGRAVYARAELERRLEAPYDESGWLEALDTLGVRQAEDATGLVSQLVERSDLSDGERARLLLADGRRWADHGAMGRARERFEQAVRAAPDSNDGDQAALELALLRIKVATDLREMSVLADSLDSAVARIGNGLGAEASYAAVLRGAAAVLDTVRSSGLSENSLSAMHLDLDMFLYAEDLRDRVSARNLAAAMFRSVQEELPLSSIAPKALLAVVHLQPESADSLLLVVHSDYATSPYVLQLKGVAADRYAALEDSLRALTHERRGLKSREN